MCFLCIIELSRFEQLFLSGNTGNFLMGPAEGSDMAVLGSFRKSHPQAMLEGATLD
jgi:hypothetical protein